MAKTSCGHQEWKRVQRLLDKFIGRITYQKTLNSKTSSLTGEIPQQLVYSPREAGKSFWLLLCVPPVLASFSRHLPQTAPGMGRPLICQGIATLTWLFLRKRGWDDCSHGFQQYSYQQQKFHTNYEVLVAILTIFFNIFGIWQFCFWSGIRFFFLKSVFLVMNQRKPTMKFQVE